MIPQVQSNLNDAVLLKLFETPVMMYEWPDGPLLADKLKELIYKKMNASKGIVVSNIGGWHSEKGIENTWDEDCIKELIHKVHLAKDEVIKRTVNNPTESHFNNWESETWANVNWKNSFNASHAHMTKNTIWSGIFYVETGDAENNSSYGGRTIFENRSMVPKEIINNNNPFENEFAVVPKKGLMVFFPSSLHHYVEKYTGDKKRITIAFNLKHTGFVIPDYSTLDEHKKEISWMWKNFRGIMNLQNKVIRTLKKPSGLMKK
jgi:uncharacterized protein (TIGR02466 family)